MKIISPSATLLKHKGVTPYEFIERVGRVCYKSEDYIKEGSAEKMVSNLIERGHLAMLEHEHIYLNMSSSFMNTFLQDMSYYGESLNFFNITNWRGLCVLSGSFRSFIELFRKCMVSYPLYHIKHILKTEYPLVFGNPDKDYVSAYSEGDCYTMPRDIFVDSYLGTQRTIDIISKHLIHSVLFVCDRGVSHEFVRHRVASFAQESTRYCNYSKDKFGKEITVIKPCFFNQESYLENVKYESWENVCKEAEKAYFNLLDLGATPQEARTVLPNSLKTELVITATEKEWQHIVNLRYLGHTGTPHPQMKEVMSMIVDDLYKESHGRITQYAEKGVK